MYIFLDIDGVLNTEKDWKTLFSLNKKNIDAMCQKYKDSRIILISSWKAGFISPNNPRNMSYVKELENSLTNGVRIVGKTISKEGQKRNHEISRYLGEHPQIKDYIIIDDDASEYEKDFLSSPHLLLIDSKTGYK